MSADRGMGNCCECHQQIAEGAPIGVLSHVPFLLGHKDCVDAKKVENHMVKIGRQQGPGGPVPTQYEEGIQGSITLEKKDSLVEEFHPDVLRVAATDNTADVIEESAPEGGILQQEVWRPEDFPQLTVDWIPYTSNPQLRPDPTIIIQPDGWAYIQVGTVRLALPNREEWEKLVRMMATLWATFEAKKADSTLIEPAE